MARGADAPCRLHQEAGLTGGTRTDPRFARRPGAAAPRGSRGLSRMALRRNGRRGGDCRRREPGRCSHPVTAAAAFAVAYVGVAALGVPAVAAMTVAAGALFGSWVGAPLAIASKAAGATIAMLVARHVLRDRIAARLPGLALRFEAAAGADGAALCSPRVSRHSLPFALVNLAAGLSPMPARTFAAVTAAGVAAARPRLRFGGRGDRDRPQPGRTFSRRVSSRRSRSPARRRSCCAHAPHA